MLIKTNQRPFNRKLMNLRMDPLFYELLFFLIEKKDENITLKQIKHHLRDISYLNSFIDELINFGLIGRYHGTYAFSGVYITKKEQSKINEITRHELDCHFELIKKIIESITSEIPPESFSLSLVFHLFEAVDSDILAIYEDAELAKNWLSLPTRVTEVKIKKPSLMSLGHFMSIYDNNMADYFNFLTLKQDNLPECYQSLYTILGDLNSTYFTTYACRQLRRLAKGKKISTETPNIFMEALHFTDFVGIDGTDYYLKAKQIITDIDWSHLDELIKQLTKRVKIIEASNAQKCFMVKSIFILWLVENKVLTLPTCLTGML